MRGSACGMFTVTARCGPGRLRVEVALRGRGWWPTGPLDGDGADAVVYACGLAVVAGLANRFGTRARQAAPQCCGPK